MLRETEVAQWLKGLLDSSDLSSPSTHIRSVAPAPGGFDSLLLASRAPTHTAYTFYKQTKNLTFM